MEKLNLRNQRFKKFNKLRLHVDKELHKKSEYDALKLTARKNKPFFEERLSVMIGKPKEFWLPLWICQTKPLFLISMQLKK